MPEILFCYYSKNKNNQQLHVGDAMFVNERTSADYMPPFGTTSETGLNDPETKKMVVNVCRRTSKTTLTYKRLVANGPLTIYT